MIRRKYGAGWCRGAAIAAALLVTPRQLPSQSGQPQAVLANGYRFTYLEHGDGRPVLLVHGGLTDFRFWQGQQQDLGDGIRVISYSRRYHYPNPWRPGDPPTGYVTEAGDLLALIRALRLERPVVVGHGAGATVALAAALREPGLLGGLVLVEPLLDSLIADSALRRASASADSTAWAAADSARQLRDLGAAPRAFLTASLGPGGWERIPPADRTILLENSAALGAATGTQPAIGCPALAVLTLPVRLLEGERTAPRFRATDDGLLRCLPAARRETVPEAGHAAPWTHPSQFNAALRRTLAGILR